MLAQDVGKDDIVTISLPNCNALYEIAFACWKIGATPSLVSYRLPRSEFDAVLDLLGPQRVFSSDPDILTSTPALPPRSEEHTSELQSLMRISYAVFRLKKKQLHNNYYKLPIPEH